MEKARPSSIHVTSAQWARSIFIALLPVLAVFLGGSTAKAAEGLILLLLGWFLLLQPPRCSLGWPLNLAFVSLALWPAISFLPHNWFFVPAWRTALTNDFGINLPNALTPQPWLTFGCWISLVAGLCWLYRVCAQRLELRVVRFQLRLFATGVIIVAGLSILFYLAHRSLPWWHNERGFGPFPNRNQTADLLGVTSVLLLACAQDDIRRGRARWIFWSLGLVLIVVAIILNFSRAGLVILVAASAIWVAIVALRVGSAVRIALGVSFLLLLFTALLLAGGSTLARFHLQHFAGADFPSDFRWLIFSDAWNLIRSSPWSGIGLGNFEPVFAIFRDASRGNTRALHPESDWLWIWSEMGIVPVLIIVSGSALLIRRVWPLQEGTNQRFRIAALIGALMFMLHGIVDVSGHRVGTAYSAMFLLGLALHRPFQFRNSPAVSWIFRLLGLGLLGAGFSWVIANHSLALLPGAIGVANAKQHAVAANRGRNFSEAIETSNRGLAWAPLDWELYYLRAAAEVAQNMPEENALDDFRRARFLEPNSYSLPLQEGFVWLHVRPALAANAWREALRRAGTERQDVFRNIIFKATLRDPAARPIIEQLAYSQHDLALIYFAQLNADEFRPAFSEFFGVDPDLLQMKPEEKRELFDLWDKRGDPNALRAAVEKHPEWLQFAWRPVAKARAASGDFRAACELVQKFDGNTPLPPLETGQSVEQLRDRVYRADNFSAGYTLFRTQMESGKVSDALDTIRHFTNRGAVPVYFHLLEAEAWAANEKWDKAWNAWKDFEKAKGTEL